MGFFSRKLTLDEILSAIADLSDDEKAKVKESFEGKSEEETPSAEPEGKDTAEETVDAKTESEDSTEECDSEGEYEEDAKAVEEATEAETSQDAVAEEHATDIIQGLAERISDVEEKLANLDKLRERMEEYEKKTADRFGYRTDDGKAGKNIYDMTADELEGAIRRGEV